MNAKGQAALEFLTTYSWAILAVILTLGVLYYFGVFDFAKFLPQECLFPSQFECAAFTFIGAPSNELRFRLVNNIGETVNVKSFSVTNDDAVPLACNTAPASITVKCGDAPQGFLPFDWDPGLDCDFTIGGCSGGAFDVKSRTEAELEMTYCAIATPGCPATSNVDHIVAGEIIAIVT